MKYFRFDNTEGFTQDQLDKMNCALELKMKFVDCADPHYEDLQKEYGKQILDAASIAARR